MRFGIFNQDAVSSPEVMTGARAGGGSDPGFLPKKLNFWPPKASILRNGTQTLNCFWLLFRVYVRLCEATWKADFVEPSRAEGCTIHKIQPNSVLKLFYWALASREQEEEVVEEEEQQQEQ